MDSYNNNINKNNNNNNNSINLPPIQFYSNILFLLLNLLAFYCFF